MNPISEDNSRSPDVLNIREALTSLPQQTLRELQERLQSIQRSWQKQLQSVVDVSSQRPSLENSCSYQIYSGSPYDTKALCNDLNNNDLNNSDISIVVKGVIFYAHRNVLSAAIPILKTLIEQTTNSDKKHIQVEDISAAIWQTILYYMYTGVLAVDENNIIEVLHAAGRLKVKKISDQAHVLIKDILKIENAGTLYLQSKIIPVPDHAQQEIKQFIITNSLSLSKSKQFLSLSKEILQEFLKEKLPLTIEQLFSAMVNWIHAQQPALSSAEVRRLLQGTGYETVSRQQLFGIVEPSGLVPAECIIALCKLHAGQESKKSTS